MAASSKLWERATCYELGHVWTPSCLASTLSIANASVKYSFKLYAAFYLISALVRKRSWPYFQKGLPVEILQSTAFLSTNAALFMNFICVYRHICGGFYTGFGFLSSFPACCIAILTERKSRRGMLALYTTNLAMEVLFNMCKQRGFVSPIKNGEVLLFAAASAIIFFLLRKGNCLTKDAKSALKLLVGNSEMPASEQESNQDTGPSSSHPGQQDSPSFTQFLPKMLQTTITNFINRLKDLSKHSLCLHESSCLYYSLEAFLRRFFLGYTIQGFINVLRALSSAFSNPGEIPRALYHKDNFSLGLFLGFYSGLFRSISCLLRRLRNKDNPIHGLLAGFIAGLSAMFYRSKTLSLYLTSKAAENVFFKLQDLKYLPIIPHGDVLLYALTTSVVLQAAVFEPHQIRPAYWKFLCGLTGNKFALMNRKLLDVSGTQASKLYPDYWPQYDTRFTPNLQAAGLV
ncbi:transmembrane protein 135-like isoform X1 [Strongylocentrotus purpuratus]|uniref:Transmembrane protein 135 N-terminal domain-containing protein n=1 Tax=Strongylocentrotus purpuratus TaxID=7668 RepID=A0A7M7PGS2_STRPU|nr:transmembrane protein 135 isoform X2 [Strongylocentrotus purpuratus]XP_030851737.1 transmembrane protein 135-like isoform X1 [Strongylocentrotus purpuratus]